jgi:7,8-dihydropterin-6-yl-methyl-4-(beta-D-ribofuranosyl)aminobenzene 5'-phosphate synthase
VEVVGDSPHLLVRESKGWIPAPYQDDMALVIEVAAGLVLLCGCCHTGLFNTLAHVRRAFERPIAAVADGTHLVNANANHLRQVSEVLLEMESVPWVYLNHCSGEVAFHPLRLTLGPDIVRPCPAGTLLGF